MEPTLDFIVGSVIPELNKGLKTSLVLIVPSAVMGLVLGIIVGALRVYGHRAVAFSAETYVSLFRGTPLVVQLFFWYFALPHVEIGGHRLVLSSVQASVLGFTLCSAAYHSEYIRGGLLSIRRGQIRAAQALGFTPFSTVTRIVLPQAVRRALPGCGNEIVYLVKYSSLAYIVACNELTGMARGFAKSTFRHTEVYATAGFYYLVMVTLATIILARIEARLSLPGFETKRT